MREHDNNEWVCSSGYLCTSRNEKSQSGMNIKRGHSSTRRSDLLCVRFSSFCDIVCVQIDPYLSHTVKCHHD